MSGLSCTSKSIGLRTFTIMPLISAYVFQTPVFLYRLLNANSLTTIKDDAFSGLPHLEYL